MTPYLLFPLLFLGFGVSALETPIEITEKLTSPTASPSKFVPDSDGIKIPPEILQPPNFEREELIPDCGNVGGEVVEDKGSNRHLLSNNGEGPLPPPCKLPLPTEESLQTKLEDQGDVTGELNAEPFLRPNTDHMDHLTEDISPPAPKWGAPYVPSEHVAPEEMNTKGDGGTDGDGTNIDVGDGDFRRRLVLGGMKRSSQNSDSEEDYNLDDGEEDTGKEKTGSDVGDMELDHRQLFEVNSLERRKTGLRGGASSH